MHHCQPLEVSQVHTLVGTPQGGRASSADAPRHSDGHLRQLAWELTNRRESVTRGLLTSTLVRLTGGLPSQGVCSPSARKDEVTSSPRFESNRESGLVSKQRPQADTANSDSRMFGFDEVELDPIPDWDRGDEDLLCRVTTSRLVSQDSPVDNLAQIQSEWAPFDTPHNAEQWQDSEQGQTADADRRAFPRRESGCIVALYVLSPQEALTPDRIDWLLHSTRLKGNLVDVSMSGIALQIEEPVESGKRVLLRVSNRRLDQHVDCPGSVLRCSPARDGLWNVVCRLDKHLSFEQIHLIGKHLFASTIV